MYRLACAGALGLALAGCSGGGPDAPPSGPRTISSRFWTDHWVDDGSTIQAPGATPGTTVTALVPDGSVQGYEVFPGTVTGDGTVTIPDVPAGDYLLRIETPYLAYRDEPTCVPSCVVPVERIDTRVVQFATSTPPLSALVAHRPDLARSAAPTPVQLRITNLDPDTTQASQLWVESAQADLDLQVALATAGATEYVGEVDWTTGQLGPRTNTGLPSAAAGDVVHVIQRAYRSVPTWSDTARNRVTTRAAQLTDLTIVGGVGGAIDVALAAVPLSESISLQLGALAFQALGPGLSPPGATKVFESLSAGVYAAPHSVTAPAPSSRGATPGPWARLFFADAFGPFTTDADLGTIAYGGFLPPLWTELLQVAYGPMVTLVVPGTGQEVFGYPSIFWMVPRSAAPSGKIGPVLGPPRAPMIAGRDAWTTQADVGATPLLSWTAPALGTPTAYEVTVVPADPADRGVSARVYVPSFRVPPGILVAGHHYFAYVTAVAGPAFDRDSDPFVSGLPRHQADCLTALFSP